MVVVMNKKWSIKMMIKTEYQPTKSKITVDYCLAYLMVANYFTKPLQGKAFKMFHDFIMGCGYRHPTC